MAHVASYHKPAHPSVSALHVAPLVIAVDRQSDVRPSTQRLGRRLEARRTTSGSLTCTRCSPGRPDGLLDQVPLNSLAIFRDTSECSASMMTKRASEGFYADGDSRRDAQVDEIESSVAYSDAEACWR
uniref:Uncharacterized protein n=1 Tax=Peronospora matthiolae TaxID=2874970 RepID=A0AAV1UIQ0_9STRA